MASFPLRVSSCEEERLEVEEEEEEEKAENGEVSMLKKWEDGI